MNKEEYTKKRQEAKEVMMTECYHCVHKRSIVYDAHIGCVKPDLLMTGNQHGIDKGWFMYPINYDPTWKTAFCNNFKFHDSVNPAVSGAVSRETHGR